MLPQWCIPVDKRGQANSKGVQDVQGGTRSAFHIDGFQDNNQGGPLRQS